LVAHSIGYSVEFGAQPTLGARSQAATPSFLTPMLDAAFGTSDSFGAPCQKGGNFKLGFAKSLWGKISLRFWTSSGLGHKRPSLALFVQGDF